MKAECEMTVRRRLHTHRRLIQLSRNLIKDNARNVKDESRELISSRNEDIEVRMNVLSLVVRAIDRDCRRRRQTISMKRNDPHLPIILFLYFVDDEGRSIILCQVIVRADESRFLKSSNV